MTTSYCAPSGRIPPLALPIVALHALAALPVAWLCAWVEVRTAGIVHVLTTLAYAFWLAYLGRHAATHAKVRSPVWMGRFGLLIGVVGWYAHWAIWLAMTTTAMGAFVLLAHPGDVFAAALALGQGSGWLRVLGWAVEALLLLGFARGSARDRADEPFCEAANAWAERVELPGKFAFIDAPQAAARFLQDCPQQVAAVLAPWTEAAGPDHAEATIHRCRAGSSWLSIVNMQAKPGKEDGKPQYTPQPVLVRLALPGVDVDRLLQQLTASRADDAAQRPTPPELAPALEQLEAEQYEAVLGLARPYLDADEPGLCADARRMCALASSRLGHWEAARGYWEALFEVEAGAMNAVQVASSSAMAGDVASGAQWLERARMLNGVRPQLPNLTLLTNYLSALGQSGQFETAMPYLDEVRSCYEAVGTTDPTVLFMHQIPPLSAFLDNSRPIVRANLEPEQARLWYTAMLPHLDDSGKQQVGEWLAQHFATA